MRHVATEVREWDDPLPGAELGEVTYEITRQQWIETWLEILVVIAALATIPVTYLQARGETGTDLLIADWTIWLIFTVEYLALMRFASNRREYARREWLPLFIIIVSFPLLPHLLALARLLRLVRLVRLFRLFRRHGFICRRAGLLLRLRHPPSACSVLLFHARFQRPAEQPSEGDDRAHHEPERDG
jgi:hypothetical protein